MLCCGRTNQWARTRSPTRSKRSSLQLLPPVTSRVAARRKFGRSNASVCPKRV